MAKKKRYYKSSGMMPSGMGQYANMPQKSFVKMFPMNYYMDGAAYPDTLGAIDQQRKADVNKARSIRSNIKY